MCIYSHLPIKQCGALLRASVSLLSRTHTHTIFTHKHTYSIYTRSSYTNTHIYMYTRTSYTNTHTIFIHKHTNDLQHKHMLKTIVACTNDDVMGISEQSGGLSVHVHSRQDISQSVVSTFRLKCTLQRHATQQQKSRIWSAMTISFLYSMIVPILHSTSHSQYNSQH